MKYVVNWIPLRIRVRSRKTQPHLNSFALSFRRKGQDKVPKTIVCGKIASDYG